MKRLSALVLTALLLSFSARASTPVPVSGNPGYSGTIASTNTFQSVQGVTNNRLGCTIQNNGTHTMYVYFGAIANATTGSSATLTAGQSVNCWILPGYVLKDQVSITGTSGDAFYGNFQ